MLKLHEMPTAVFKLISSASEWYAVSSPRLPCTQRSCAINRWIFGQNWPGLSEQHLSPQLLTAVKKKTLLIFDAISSMAIYQNEIRQSYTLSYTASYHKHLRTLHSSAARNIFFWQRSGAEGAGLAASPASVWKCVCEHWGYTSYRCVWKRQILYGMSFAQQIL